MYCVLKSCSHKKDSKTLRFQEHQNIEQVITRRSSTKRQTIKNMHDSSHGGSKTSTAFFPLLFVVFWLNNYYPQGVASMPIEVNPHRISVLRDPASQTYPGKESVGLKSNGYHTFAMSTHDKNLHATYQGKETLTTNNS